MLPLSLTTGVAPHRRLRAGEGGWGGRTPGLLPEGRRPAPEPGLDQLRNRVLEEAVRFFAFRRRFLLSWTMDGLRCSFSAVVWYVCQRSGISKITEPPHVHSSFVLFALTWSPVYTVALI